jgi:glutathione S-transferase
MYTLYYLPGTCSLAVHAVLIDVGADYELKNVAVPAGEPRPSEYLKINPRGSVPTLVDGDFVLREGSAILQYLIEKHQSPLLPTSGLERATALEWLAFANATLHPAYTRCLFLARQPEININDSAVYIEAVKLIQKNWDDIENRLTTSSYLAGDNLTIADILTTVISNWTPMLQQSINFGDKTKKLFRKILALKCYQTAMEKEGISYKIDLQ